MNILWIIGLTLFARGIIADENNINDVKEDTLEDEFKAETPIEQPQVVNTQPEDSTTEELNDKEEEVNNGGEGEEESASDEESVDEDGYKKGSMCIYCKYCKLCNLCDEKCPCKEDEKSENCDMCKYCKYCYLCGSVCDNVCTPGSFLDMFSSAIYGALPTFNEKTKESINDDINKAKDFIKEYL